MSREKAIEAARRTIREAPWRRRSRRLAEEVVDAVTPHLAGEPVGYAVVDAAGEWISTGQRVWHARDVRGAASRLNEDGEEGHRVVALVPVDEP